MEATQDDLRRLLKRLDPDPAVAWETYLSVWQKLVTFFQCNKCHAASDQADEALSRIARRDDLDSIRNFGAFAYGVARTMRSEIHEKLKRDVPLDGFPEGDIPDSKCGNLETRIVEGIDTQRKVECFLQCLDKLPHDDRALLLAFKLADRETRVGDRRKLAAEAGVSASTLRVRVSRIGSDMERCARKCLKQRTKTTF